MAPPSIGYRYLGTVSYRQALALQRALVEYRLAARRSTRQGSERVWDHNVLLLLQHPPVYTTGIRRFAQRNPTKEDSDAEAERQRLEQLGAQYTRRGGQITFHGPGQLVGYPLLDITEYKLGVRHYVCALEKALIAACHRYGLKADADKETGVWIGNHKIAAIGIEIRRYITSHGFALNCNTDLDWFKHIIPCGLEGRGVTSIAQALREQQQRHANGQYDMHAHDDRWDTNVDVEDASRHHSMATVEHAIPVVVDAMAEQFQCPIQPLEQMAPALSRSIDELLLEPSLQQV
ncbi:hypothetical protein SYNPS1DRAFT_13033 [Syncephalis pseudoplumigaleata]|uniref:lipoyl(octanoyl) transferase n=1 Tax=Syncephalis pseudoplumigaleata TaxID=1712513 RepID=A0A4P9Z3T4_9FUNG|nr:hypothetical protein SYNPS1DRAFT_13033 [Syncephalis pseudoplumigaleata]|eukprot:RKP27213.1 hypothetical protein SYNPS1DRAFT_13033 [Syncephalis pseudoplumigaleata]